MCLSVMSVFPGQLSICFNLSGWPSWLDCFENLGHSICSKACFQYFWFVSIEVMWSYRSQWGHCLKHINIWCSFVNVFFQCLFYLINRENDLTCQVNYQYSAAWSLVKTKNGLTLDFYHLAIIIWQSNKIKTILLDFFALSSWQKSALKWIGLNDLALMKVCWCLMETNR